MNILIWLLVGGLIGWIANMLMHVQADPFFVVNIATGVAGALAGGWLVTPLLWTATGNGSLQGTLSIFVSLACAVLLLAAVHLMWRMRRTRHASSP